MPEGHTIHRIARDHSRDFVGQQLAVISPQGRFAAGARKLNGRTLESVEAHGKHLCYHWSNGRLLHIHLGLYGKFRSHRIPAPEPRGQVRLRVIGQQKAFDLNGPNACELVRKKNWLTILRRLGEDPLRADSDSERAWSRISRSRAPIGTLLLNQSIISGVGNVYRSEVLHLLGIHPNMPGKSLSRGQYDSLWSTLSSLLRIGVRYNRIIVAEPAEIGKPRGRMSRDERLLVYKKDHCIRCDSKIESWLLGTRRVYACPKCQTA
jgi:endonuclease-8